MTSPNHARTKGTRAAKGASTRTRQRRPSTDPPLTADADRILAVCRPAAAVTTETNVLPTGHALGGRQRGPHPHAGLPLTGYYLDRGVNARFRRLSHGASQAAASLHRSRADLPGQPNPLRLSFPIAGVRIRAGSPYRHVLGVALALGKLLDLQIAPDVQPLTSDEQARDRGNQMLGALRRAEPRPASLDRRRAWPTSAGWPQRRWTPVSMSTCTGGDRGARFPPTSICPPTASSSRRSPEVPAAQRPDSYW